MFQLGYIYSSVRDYENTQKLFDYFLDYLPASFYKYEKMQMLLAFIYKNRKLYHLCLQSYTKVASEVKKYGGLTISLAIHLLDVYL